MMSNSSDLKVVIVDDSPLILQMLKEAIDNHPGMSVVGMAEDAFEARDVIKQTNPDVITLDVEMPKMSGLEFLEKIIKLRPMPVIMVSTLTQKGADITLRALEIGAVDYVPKPDLKYSMAGGVEYFAAHLIPKLENVRNISLDNIKAYEANTDTIFSPSTGRSPYDLIGIASSTGGIERLRHVYSRLEKDMPPIMTVQHINHVYVDGMIERMQQIVPKHIMVKKASKTEKLERNTIYFADNTHHLEVKTKGGKLYSYFHDEPPLNGFKASADYLFSSMSRVEGHKMLGVIISGMGSDGAQGCLALRQNSIKTIGENKASCLVYGMSKAAMEIGGIDEEMSIKDITAYINS